MLAYREIIECQPWWPSAGCRRRLPDDPRQSARKQSGAVDARERQALLGDLDSQDAERRRRACAGSCGQSFHCFRYWRTAALSRLMASWSFTSSLQRRAQRIASSSLPSLAFCRAVCMSLAAVSDPRDSPFGRMVRRVNSSGGPLSASQDITSATPSALVPAGNSSASIRTLPVDTFIIRRTGTFLEHVSGNVEISSKFMTYASL